MTDTEQKLREAEAREAVLAQHLDGAANAISDWGEYANEYFQNKHGLSDDVHYYKSVVSNVSARAKALLAVLDAARKVAVRSHSLADYIAAEAELIKTVDQYDEANDD